MKITLDNWRAKVERAVTNDGQFADADRQRVIDWSKCALGEGMALRFGREFDTRGIFDLLYENATGRQILGLGLQFASAVSSDNTYLALETIVAIEDRLATWDPTPEKQS